jgi:hypothetical protein
MDHVHQRQVVAQHAQVCQPLHRALAGMGQIPFRIAHGERHVRGNAQARSRAIAVAACHSSAVLVMCPTSGPGRDLRPSSGQAARSVSKASSAAR